MSEMHSQKPIYVMGHNYEEDQRLLLQGRILNPFTRRLLSDAGISRGMTVLDVGCGAGDVSLIAAELVGKEGRVLAVDNNASVLELAQARAEEAGLSQITFQTADIHQLASGQQFDAIVGRLVLMHVPNPSALVRQLLTQLREGGLVAFQELDIHDQTESALPASPLWQRSGIWCKETFERAGVELRPGMKLPNTFLEAGLPLPQLRYEAAIGTGPDWEGYDWYVSVVRSLMPLMIRFGIASAEEIGIEHLAKRLRAESRERGGIGGVMHIPALVSAWTRAVR